MELNREQIIKALECCANGTSEACMECPLRLLPYPTCRTVFARDALDLYRELAEEKEGLGYLIDELEKEKRDLFEENKRVAKENERLKAQRYIAYPDGRIEMIPTVEAVKADTVRKMQERFNQVFGGMDATNALLRRTFDKIAQEMLEEA